MSAITWIKTDKAGYEHILENQDVIRVRKNGSLWIVSVNKVRVNSAKSMARAKLLAEKLL